MTRAAHPNPPPTVWRDAAVAREVHGRYEQQIASWPVPARPLTIATDLGATFVLTCGVSPGAEGDTALPVVLLHGAGATSAVWQTLAVDLSLDRRVIMIDLLGEPGFSAPSRPDLTTAASADWLGQVLDELEVGVAAIVGTSFGGWTAVDFATRRPERVDRLALLAPAGIGRQKSLSGALLLLLMGERGRQRSVERITGLAGADHPEILAEIDLVFRSFRPRTQKYPLFTDGRLRALTMPVLAVLGERDRVFRPRQTRHRLATLVPDVRVHLEPGAGHALLGQDTRIADFIRG